MSQIDETDGPVTSTGNDIILRIRDLHVHFFTDIGVAKALNGVSFDVPARKVMGLVGESGCGKSVTALTCMRLVQKPGRIMQGEVKLYRRRRSPGMTLIDEVDLLSLDPQGQQIRDIRGGEIAMIFQEPMTSLNPSYTIGEQISEAIVLHQGVDRAEAQERSIGILDQVGLANPKAMYGRYPHVLSGGMRQRAMIAMGLSCHPSLLFADEPTTALDVTTEAQILDLMRDLKAEMDMTIVFITHNLGVVAQMCDYVTVMYLGRVVEQAAVKPLFYTPKHPYTEALLNSIPQVGSGVHNRLKPIRGIVPDPFTSIRGCPFHPRCASYMPGTCDQAIPAVTTVEEDHTVRCFLYSDEVEK
jgi:peptide/nickel transport system ATP-binding protein